MSPSPENDLQVTIRMPTELKKAADAEAERLEISTMEWIRRAMKEKLSHVTPTTDDPSMQSLREEILEIRNRISILEQEYTLLTSSLAEQTNSIKLKKER